MSKLWKLGDYRAPFTHGGALPTQTINYGKKFPEINHHESKIEVHGDNCKQIAKMLAATLNAAGVTHETTR